MPPSCQSLEHGPCLIGIAWLAQDLAVDDHDCVGGQNPFPCRSPGPGLFLSETLHMQVGTLAGQQRFIQIRGTDGEIDPQTLEKLSAPWRS